MMSHPAHFDETKIERRHVQEAIQRFLSNPPDHRAPRSAYLVHAGQRLPAKLLVGMAHEIATGHRPISEEYTGGRASVRVLEKLGFETLYLATPPKSGQRNPEKSRRRAALRRLLEREFGPASLEHSFDSICVPDLVERQGLDPRIERVLAAVEAHRGYTVCGQKGRALKFDFYFERARLLLEFDERQHFTLPRAASLRSYPRGVRLGYDKLRWLALSEELRRGDNCPKYRDEQRALYDAIRDFAPSALGLAPLVRVFEDEVAWEREGPKSVNTRHLVSHIRRVIASV
jgi:hypothetical protein